MRIALSIDISCPPDEVFPWIAEADKAMRWQKGVKGGQVLKETPEKIGTTFREEMQENGNTLVMYGEITSYIQDRSISFHLESRVHSVEVTYSIVGSECESTFAAESVIHWKFPLNVLSLIMGRKMQERILRQTEAEFAELKRLCEANKGA